MEAILKAEGFTVLAIQGAPQEKGAVDCAEDDLRADMPVEVTFREVAPGYTLPLFAPAS